MTPKTSRLDRFADAIVRFIPDAITSSVILLVILVAGALLLGDAPLKIAEAYYQGFWSLLPFTGQMSFVILMGGALSKTPFFRRLIERLARVPRTANQLITLAVLMAATASYCFWGLGYALGPLIAIHFAREAERKGIAIHFPFLLATTFASNAVWQFGLSASAPLLIATPGHFLEKSIGVVPLSRTIWSPAALLDVGLYITAVMITGCLLMPKTHRPLSHFAGAQALTEPDAHEQKPPVSYSEKLEHHTATPLLLCAALLTWLWIHFIHKGASLNINSLNITLLLLTLWLHGSVKNFSRALEKAAASAWPIIVLYHLYAGLSGLIEHTSVGMRAASLVAAASSPTTFPALSAVIGTVFAFFIPSSGGQWAVQGLVTTQSAMAVGVSVERALLSMSVGDHMGNLTAPFWYVIVAGVARVDFRTFFGYGLIYAALWFAIGAVVFTFAPC